MKILPSIALAVAASAALAGPAAAKSTTYTGKASGGHQITFKVSGNKVSKIETMVPAVCLSTQSAIPRNGGEIYRPPGSFTIGAGKQKVSELQDAAMHYAPVTKNYHVTVKRKGRAITGKLHVNFSFLTLSYGYSIGTIPWICQGDATFTAKAR